MPKISVIIPVYNVEKYLERCINSVRNQTMTDWQILLVDDGSDDNSPKLCDEYAKADPRIHVCHKKNGGASSARNTGIDMAEGEYLCFLDSDDTLYDYSLEKLVSAAEKENADIVFGGYNIKNDIYCIDYVCEKEQLIKLYFELIGKKIYYASWAKLFKRNIIIDNNIRFNPEQKCNEDYTFNCIFCKYVQRAAFIRDVIYWYNLENETSITKTFYMDYYRYLIMGYEAIYEWIQAVGADESLAKDRAKKIISACILNYSTRVSIQETAEYVKKSFELVNEIYTYPPSEYFSNAKISIDGPMSEWEKEMRKFRRRNIPERLKTRCGTILRRLHLR